MIGESRTPSRVKNKLKRMALLVRSLGVNGVVARTAAAADARLIVSPRAAEAMQRERLGVARGIDLMLL